MLSTAMRFVFVFAAGCDSSLSPPPLPDGSVRTDAGRDREDAAGIDAARADAGDTPEGDGGGPVPADAGPPGVCGNELSSARAGGLSDVDLSTAGDVFAVDLATGDYSPRVTEGNGCEVIYEATGGLGGAPGLRIEPPTEYVGENSQYCGFASGADLWSGATVDIAQINIRYALFIGRGYSTAMAGGGPKALIPYTHDRLERGLDGVRGSRPMVFWGSSVGPTYGAIGVTAETVASYQEPEVDYWPIGGGAEAIVMGPAPDHAGAATEGTPVIGDEWVVIEHEIDLRRDRGNPDGINRLYVWTQDGAIAGVVLDIPLTWNGSHDFSGRYIGSLDGLGYYWNRPAVAREDDHVIYSHLAFSANRAPSDPIGPPPGFTDCPR
jgi:hypothetical protein